MEFCPLEAERNWSTDGRNEIFKITSKRGKKWVLGGSCKLCSEYVYKRVQK